MHHRIRQPARPDHHHCANLSPRLHPRIMVTCSRQRHCKCTSLRSPAAMRTMLIQNQEPESYKTTYTIFCPDANPPTCDLSLEFPFILIQGPGSIQFHGTHTSTLTANLECTLHGSTEATCSGYSSYKEGYNNGAYDGPLETSWTSTFSGTEVEWGVLTMAEMPHDDDDWGITATWTTPTGVSDYTAITATADGEGGGVRLQGSARGAILAAACVFLLNWFS